MDGWWRPHRTAMESFRPLYSPFNVAKWVDRLPLPQVYKPLAVGNGNQPWGAQAPALYTDVDPDQSHYHGIAPEFFKRTVAGTDTPYFQRGETQWYDLRIKAGSQQMIRQVVTSAGQPVAQPVNTPIVGYNGQWPGPLFKTRVGQPVVVRNYNDTNEHFSTHLHGGHNASHADGYATFVVEPGKYRDHYYANTVPMHNGKPDFGESPSTMWYHDHGIDLTEKHVLEGAAGFWQTFDDLELNLVRNKVLPGWWDKSSRWNETVFMSSSSPYDIPMVIQDRQLNADGSIFHDPLDFDGYLGDIQTVNGKAYPTLEVGRTKYRFRILDGANARHYNLQLRDSQGRNPSFIGIGSDGWLYPQAIKRDTLFLTPANRADVVVDFSKYKNGDVLYLDNILEQTDGRGPKGDPLNPNPVPGEPLLKFVVRGNPVPAADIPKVAVGTRLRPQNLPDPNQVSATRVFRFHRSNGHWQINQKDFIPEIADSTPSLGTVERWIFQNSSGGWAHPVHVHLEGHTIETFNGRPPLPEDRWKRDTTMLTANGEFSALIQFRTFEGPFGFHCHTLGHEDLMMMASVDPTVNDTRPDGAPISRNFAPPAFNPYVHPEPGGTHSGAMAVLANTLKLSSDCRHGTNQADGLKGTRKNDCLYGIDGDDTISGGKGDDLISGAKGSDTMSGNRGADVFEFDPADINANDHDLITDFDAAGGDRILISGPAGGGGGHGKHQHGNANLAFIGAGPFVAGRAAVRFSGGLLEADLNGDASADLTVTLLGVGSFEPAWLLSH